MNKPKIKIGYIGLGKMGKNMVLRLLEQDVEVVVWNRSPGPLSEVVAAGAEAASSIQDLAEKLGSRKVIWLMLPHGAPTDEVLGKLKPFLHQGDLVIDGANAHYEESIRHGADLTGMGVRFMDVGVSGGPGGARNGACLMVGGDRGDFDQLNWLFEKLAAPNAFGYFGQVGAGHFAKMVHNGIEYGMMEAIAEGAAVLKSSNYQLDLAEVFRVYNNASVIESRLVGWAQEAFAEDGSLSKISSRIDHTGEGEWTVREAQKNGVPAPVIESALKVRLNSQNDAPDSLNGFRNKVVSALRGKFGGHEVGNNYPKPRH